MKKPKISLDSSKLKSLFVQHVEKGLLVLVIGVMLYLVYQGFSLPGLEQGKTPQGLLKTSGEMMQFIDSPNRWNEVKEERAVATDVAGRVEIDQLPADPNQYFIGARWEIPNFPKLSPRQDPKLFPPLHLVVVPKMGPLAYLRLPTDTDPLAPAPLEDGEVAPPPKAKPKAKPKPKMAAMDPMSDPMNMAGRKGRKARGEVGILDDGGAPMEEMFMPMGEMDAGVAAPGSINPESIYGFQATSEAVARNVNSMVVMAVVPCEKQFEEFQNALANSLDFDINRDSPLYLQYYVQRADVSADPAADDAALASLWQRVSVNDARDETANWAGYPAEIVDPAYTDEVLTHPAPPFLQRDLWDLVWHPDLPLPSLASAATSTEVIRERVTPRGKGAPGDDTPSLDRLGPKNSGNAGFGEAGAGMPATGGRMTPQMGRPMGMPSMPNLAGGEAGGIYGAESAAAGTPPPKYKLIRFTDTTVEPGHKYRYRIKVLLHDPNHPHQGYTPPNPASLAADVRTRVKALDDSVFFVESEWSEPSPTAELPSPHQYFAGSVKQPDRRELIPGKPPVPDSVNPTGKAVAVVWDPSKVVDVPAQVDVSRGSILNSVQDATVIHPVTRQPVELSAYAFSTNAIVADMMGGEEIPLLDKLSKKPPLTAPGELLIFDSTGKLHVQHETDDIDSLRRYLVPTGPDSQAENDPMNAAPGFGGILGGPPMPGAPPGRRIVP
jgi:hypothetical protein